MSRTYASVLVVALALWVGCSKSELRRSTAAPHFVAPPAGPVADIVLHALADARADGARLVVYVGASWCEPCRHFHDAVEGGLLPAELAGLRFLEFDSDVDGERLAAAGYDGRMLPRFVVPDADGRGTGRRFEGSIKGPGAASNIASRLRSLLDPPAPPRAARSAL